MTETQFQRLLDELAQVNRRIDKTETFLLERIDQANAETRRYFGVVAEGLESRRNLTQGLSASPRAGAPAVGRRGSPCRRPSPRGRTRRQSPRSRRAAARPPRGGRRRG